MYIYGTNRSYAHTLGCWAYDSFGNRTLNAYVTGNDCSSATTPTASYNAYNRVTFVGQASPVAYSASSGFTYDGGGNVTADGQNTYAYDSEGRLCAVKSMGGQLTAYLYDAEGLRVAKGSITSLSCTLASNGFALTNQYLLDSSGDQVTELNGSNGWVHSNVWGGAHLDATYDPKGLHFHLSDALGTRRVQTNVLGAVEETFQSLPFGDGYLATSTGLSTSDDSTEHHFTGKEHHTDQVTYVRYCIVCNV